MDIWILVIMALVLAAGLAFFLFMRRSRIGRDVFSNCPPVKSIDVGRDTAAPPRYVDENVMFTVYRPKVVAAEEWYTMVAFAHLSEKRAGAPPDAPDPVEEVKRQAGLVYGREVDRQLSTQQQSAHSVPEKGLITFTPHVEGVAFNPPSQSIYWVKDIHRVEFELRASATPQAQGIRRGGLTVFLGSLILAEVPLSIQVSNEAPAPVSKNIPTVENSARPHRKIFPSYSHKDTRIVEQFEDYVESLGDSYLRDVKTLRSGEVWSDQLQQLIAEADVFQLFWSSNSMRSDYVRQEWEYALSLKRSTFIRPTYWEDPLPRAPERELPPEALVRLHFYLLPTGAGRKAAVNRRAEPPQAAVNRRAERPPRAFRAKSAVVLASVMESSLVVYALFLGRAPQTTNTNANSNRDPNSNVNLNTNANNAAASVRIPTLTGTYFMAGDPRKRGEKVTYYLEVVDGAGVAALAVELRFRLPDYLEVTGSTISSGTLEESRPLERYKKYVWRIGEVYSFNRERVTLTARLLCDLRDRNRAVSDEERNRPGAFSRESADIEPVSLTYKLSSPGISI